MTKSWLPALIVCVVVPVAPELGEFQPEESDPFSVLTGAKYFDPDELAQSRLRWREGILRYLRRSRRESGVVIPFDEQDLDRVRLLHEE